MTEIIICDRCKKLVDAIRLKNQLTLTGNIDRVYHIVEHKRDLKRLCSQSNQKQYLRNVTT